MIIPGGCVIRMYDFKRHLLALKEVSVKIFTQNLILMHREGGYRFFILIVMPIIIRIDAVDLQTRFLYQKAGFLVHGDFLILEEVRLLALIAV